MRQLIHWTARLYPAVWRERYGGELDALIEDIQPRWEDLFNVLLGALRMQMTTWNSLKVVAAAALAGALVAGVFAFRTQERYVSTAVMRFASYGHGDSDRQGALDQLIELQQKVLSRKSLAEIITQPALDLYPEDRKRMPLEDVAQNMRDKALRIQVAPVQDGGVLAFVISCEYPDKLKAQAVVRELYKRFYRQWVATQIARGPYGPEQLEIMWPASLPERPVFPNRPVIIGVGLLGGAVLGLLAVLVWRSAARLSKSA
jgi:LPS O-antigen subunit length determinant protein (WzzB/FepE family)